jgi:hypothetical protein
MQTRRWTNPSLPQTLQMAVFLLYIDAFFSALSVLSGFASVYSMAILAATLGAGFGIANEKRWGYVLGVTVSALAFLPFLLAIFVSSDGLGRLFDLDVLISLLFPVAQLALLLHPMSRQYQRVWFS